MEYDISSTISLVSHIHSAAADFLRVRLNQHGLPNLSSSHGFILFLLSKEEKLTMSQVAKRINRDKSTATALVQKLKNSGLVETLANKDDGRSKFIMLTAKGREYNKITAKLSTELIEKFYKNFTQDERRQVYILLSRISSHFESNLL